MGALTNSNMSKIWSTPPLKRYYVPAGTPQGAIEHLVMGFAPTVGYENVEYAGSILGGVQALAEAGYPVPPGISTSKEQLKKSFEIVQKEVIKRKLEPLAFAFRGIYIANRVGLANDVTHAVAAVLAALGTVTYGITTGISVLVELVAGIKNAELRKATQGLNLVAQLWITEIDKKKAKALGKQTHAVEDTLQKAAAFQQKLLDQYKLMQQQMLEPQLAPVPFYLPGSWPWYVAGLGGAGLLIAIALKQKRGNHHE